MIYRITILLLLLVTPIFVAAGVTPNPGYVNNTFKFDVQSNSNIPTSFEVIMQLGNGSGGWLSTKVMTRQNPQYFYYNRYITQPGFNRKWRFAIRRKSNNETSAWKEGSSYTVLKESPPLVSLFTSTPSTPKMFEPISFTAKSDISTSNVKFKCGGGSWHGYNSSSNNNKTWVYSRNEGLKGATTCYVDIDGDGNSDKSLTVYVADPKFTISKTSSAPKIGENVLFSVKTDSIENAYKLQIKFLNIWYDMTPALNPSDWVGERSFSSSGNKTISFRIINTSTGNTVYSTTTSIFVGEASVSEIINFLNQVPLVAKMNLNLNQEKDLARADAVVMVDYMRVLLKSSIDKNMNAYYNPFADVPYEAEYLPSLIRLAYYKSNFNETVIKKDSLFNPMRHMTREEFVKVAINGFDIPKKSTSLSAFSDRDTISSWADKYFQTAIYYGIIVGNNGKLLPKKRISIQNALRILRRIKDNFSSNYPFTTNHYESPESLDTIQLYSKTIGFEIESRYYKPDATPISISSINKNKSGNYYALTVSSTIDISKGASDHYWWSTDKGYFREENSNGKYKTVHFYPLSSKPISDYHITVNGADNLGYIDKRTIIIGKNEFTYPEDNQVADGITANFNNIKIDNNLVANKLFTINLLNSFVRKSNLELGIDQAVVTMVANGRDYQLFQDSPDKNKIQFIMGDYPYFYGKTVILKVELYSQAKKLPTPKTYSMIYIPQFTVRGKVYNAASGTQVTSVIIDGNQEVKLDENNEFYYHLNQTNQATGLEIRTKQNSLINHFDSIYVDLNYESPSQYVVLHKKDARASLGITVSPSHVRSGEKTTFNLTSDTNIPLNTSIYLEDASCGMPNGLGTKVVNITCIASIDSIKHSLMSIHSSSLYEGGLARTIVIDKGLTDTDSDGLPDIQDLDDDNDGMPDEWEIKYGLNPLKANDALLDKDNDGTTNLNEYLQHTNPLIEDNVHNKTPALISIIPMLFNFN